jgi:hypothetical protein
MSSTRSSTAPAFVEALTCINAGARVGRRLPTGGRDEPGEAVGGFGAHAGEQVLVGVHREDRVGVPEPFGDDLDRGARCDEQRSVGVVGSDRGAVLAFRISPFPRPALRTRRASSLASGSPQAHVIELRDRSFEVRGGALAVARTNRDGELQWFWSLNLDLYARVSLEDVIVVPDFRCSTVLRSELAEDTAGDVPMMTTSLRGPTQPIGSPPSGSRLDGPSANVAAGHCAHRRSPGALHGPWARSSDFHWPLARGIRSHTPTSG